jgi:hypothetical protein
MGGEFLLDMLIDFLNDAFPVHLELAPGKGFKRHFRPFADEEVKKPGQATSFRVWALAISDFSAASIFL